MKKDKKKGQNDDEESLLHSDVSTMLPSINENSYEYVVNNDCRNSSINLHNEEHLMNFLSELQKLENHIETVKGMLHAEKRVGLTIL